MLLQVCLLPWVKVSCPSLPHGAIRPLWYYSCAAYAQLMEDSGQLYGDMVGRYRRRYAQGRRACLLELLERV